MNTVDFKKTTYNRLNLTGQVFGKLTVVGEAEGNTRGKIFWICRCTCGNATSVCTGNLRGGNTRSCGCTFRRGENYSPMHKTGDRHPNWKNGSTVDNNGYRRVLVSTGCYRLEHRVIYEKILGRKLKSSEVVHHKNGDKLDNHPENLLLISKACHTALHRQGCKATETTRLRISRGHIGIQKGELHPIWRGDITRDSIIEAITRNKTKRQAAMELGINWTTLYRKIEYFGLTDLIRKRIKEDG